MIIDVHFHVFPRLGTGECGETALKLWQYHMRDVAAFRRRDDDARVEEPLLQFPSDDVKDIPEVNFRMGAYGQAEFTIDGVDYYLQMYPPSLVNMDAPPEQMVAEMSVAGIDMAVLQSDHVYGFGNAYYGDCIRRFPGRFIGLAQTRYWETDLSVELERLARAVQEHSSRGLCFSVQPFVLNGFVDHLDDARFEPLWDLVRKLEIPIFWYLDDQRRPRIAGFMERVAELDRWTRAHPDIPSVLTHGFVPAAIIHEIGIPDQLVTILKRPNQYAELLCQAKWPEYPFVEGQERIRWLCGELGADRLMWGSDMPYGAFWCTYKQSADYIRLHCSFLSQAEKDLILGGNAARVLRLQ